MRPASCVVDGSAFSLDCFTLLLARHLADRDVKQTTFSFADGPVVCSTSLMASLIMKHEGPSMRHPPDIMRVGA